MSNTKHPLYSTWASMRNRCNNPNNQAYSYYGGRGITVCESWSDFSQFVEDMGIRPNGFTLDRVDNDGNYEPSNCKWSTVKEQRLNRGYRKPSYPSLIRKYRREHCFKGHSMTEENTYTRKYDGTRLCRVCLKTRLAKSKILKLNNGGCDE